MLICVGSECKTDVVSLTPTKLHQYTQASNAALHLYHEMASAGQRFHFAL